MLTRMLMLAVVSLTLSGCFLAPGAFTSTLDLRRDGNFAFAYKGEIVFESPGDFMKMGDTSEPWSDDDAMCYEPQAEGEEGNAAVTRSCKAAEIAEQRKTFEQGRKEATAKRAKDAAQFGAVFGYTPGDDAANRRLAATYAKFAGYRQVSYRCNGVFDVDYAVTGKLDRDFVFPLLPQQDIIFPFVAVRVQADGSARVNAPSLIGGGLRGMAAKMKDFGAAAGAKDMPASTRTRGSFTITTDGEVLTNNTEDGAATSAAGRSLKWEIGPDTQKVPEALIRLR